MPAEPILLGPFAGGLNTASDPTAVQDNDLVIMENFELDLDRALVSRPPIVDTAAAIPQGTLRLLGYYYSGAAAYLLATDSISKTYYYVGSGWVLLRDNLAASAFVQYKGKAWLIAATGSGQTGGSWSPGEGFIAVPSMPTGGSITVNKERLWIGGGKNAPTDSTRLTYSGAGQPNQWPSSTPAGGGFISIGEGDGQDIVDVINYYNDIVIFKEHSSYRFTYSASPDAGQVTPLDRTVGVADVDCVVQYRGAVYVLYGESLYELNNAIFTPVNIKVPFNNPRPPGLQRFFSVSAWDRRIFVTFFDKTYVYGIETQTWSTWKSDVIPAIGPIKTAAVDNEDEPYAFTASQSTDMRSLYRIDRRPGSVGENFTCTMQTKNYDYQVSHAFKRLMYWGSDVMSTRPVVAVVTPIAFGGSVQWKNLTKKWNDPALGSWNYLLDQSLDVSDNVDISGTRGPRKFLKFLKSLRFRQVNFRLSVPTDGTSVTGQIKVFTLTTWIAAKQTVSKKVN